MLCGADSASSPYNLAAAIQFISHSSLSLCSVLLVKSEACDLTKLSDHLSTSFITNTVILDCTASDVPPSHYLDWIKKGIHIITPNKKLGSGPLDRYLAVRQIQRESYIHWFYEVHPEPLKPIANYCEVL